MNKKQKKTAVLLLAMSVSAAVFAIPIVNFSFEDPGTVKQELSTGNVPGWDAVAGSASVGVEVDQFNATEGTWSLYAGDNSWASQLTSYAVVAGEEYKLTVDVANTWVGTEGATIELYFDDGGTAVTMGTATYAFPNVDGTEGPFEHSLIILADDTPAAIGKDLGIRLGTTNAWVGFDNVRLDVIPEPATLGMVAVFGGGILFIRRRMRNY